MRAGLVGFRDGSGDFKCPCAGFVGFREGFGGLNVSVQASLGS